MVHELKREAIVNDVGGLHNKRVARTGNRSSSGAEQHSVSGKIQSLTVSNSEITNKLFPNPPVAVSYILYQNNSRDSSDF